MLTKSLSRAGSFAAGPLWAALNAARRALATLAVTSTPGTLVVDTDPDRCLLVTHSLLPGPSRIEKAVGR